MSNLQILQLLHVIQNPLNLLEIKYLTVQTETKQNRGARRPNTIENEIVSLGYFRGSLLRWGRLCVRVALWTAHDLGETNFWAFQYLSLRRAVKGCDEILVFLHVYSLWSSVNFY